MSPFELVFSLFGLILGLALTEVLGGLARAIRLRRHGRRLGEEITPLGWLTPALAVFLLLDITGFWLIAWRAREVIPAIPPSMLFGLAVTGCYFIAATWVFPDEPPEGADLDAHFFENKRSILLLVFACNVIAHGARAAVIGVERLPVSWGVLGTYFALLLLAAFARSKRLNLIGLALLILIYLLEAIWTIAFPAGG